MLFFMVDIFQNCNYKYSKSKQYHEFFVCTHRKRLLPFKARNGGINTLSAPRVSILYCHGAAVSRFEIEKQVAFKMWAQDCVDLFRGRYPLIYSVPCGTSSRPYTGSMAIVGYSVNGCIKRLYGANIDNQSRLSVVRAIWLLLGISVLERPDLRPLHHNYQHPCI